MSVNLANKNIFQNYCKYKKLLSSSLLCSPAEYRSLSVVCECSAFVYPTSRKWCSADNKNNVSPRQIRWFSEESSPPSNKLPPLMSNFPKIVWPSLIKSIRNFILATFIIKPYLDREFNLPDFVNGSKKAVEVVSKKISEGDLKSLEGLVTNDIIPNIQKALSLMSLTQREQLAINVDDIYFCFPYQVGIIFDDDDNNKDQKRFVEITMVYHSLKGLAIMRSRGEEPPLNMGTLPEYQQRMSIGNYRFVREFTKGVDGDWTVNFINHFRPVDQEN